MWRGTGIFLTLRTLGREASRGYRDLVSKGQTTGKKQGMGTVWERGDAEGSLRILSLCQGYKRCGGPIPNFRRSMNKARIKKRGLKGASLD